MKWNPSVSQYFSVSVMYCRKVLMQVQQNQNTSNEPGSYHSFSIFKDVWTIPGIRRGLCTSIRKHFICWYPQVVSLQDPPWHPWHHSTLVHLPWWWQYPVLPSRFKSGIPHVLLFSKIFPLSVTRERPTLTSMTSTLQCTCPDIKNAEFCLPDSDRSLIPLGWYHYKTYP